MTAARFLGAGLVAVIAGGVPLAALAADLPVIYPEPTPVYKPVGGWYLRGSLGMSNQRLDRLDYQYFDEPGFEHSWLDEGGFDAGVTAGVGVGYRFNNWLRTDLTAEYRGKTSFDALDRVVETADPDNIFTNDYEAKKSEWLVLANAYADLGNFHGVVPYVGAGIGASRNTISHFTDVNIQNGAGGFADSDSEWNLAWALHAGVGYEVTDRMTVDLGYSFLHLGDATTAPAENFDPAFTRPNDGFKFEDLTSHDFKIGVRYAFN